MRDAQRGVTFLGWMVLLIPVAIVVYGGIRLTPSYLNYMRVAKSLNDLPGQAKESEHVDAAMLRGYLDRSFDIEIITYPTVKDVDIHRDGDHWLAVCDYEDLLPLIGQVSLLVHFHKEVEVP
jgi:hypothetical protein